MAAKKIVKKQTKVKAKKKSWWTFEKVLALLSVASPIIVAIVERAKERPPYDDY